MLKKVNLNGDNQAGNHAGPQQTAPMPQQPHQPQQPQMQVPTQESPAQKPRRARKKTRSQNNPQPISSSNESFAIKGGTRAMEARVSKLSKVAMISVVVAVIAIVITLYSTISSTIAINETKADMTNAVVATHTISPGSQISADDLTIKEIPANYLVENARSNIEDFVGGYAIFQIDAGAQLTTSIVAGSGNTASLSGAITPGNAAVTISVDEASGLANLIKVGDHVQVIQSDGSLNGSGSSVVSANAEVVALGSSLESTTDSYTSVTVMVPEADAQNIRAAQASGNVTLILNPASEN